MKSTPFLIVLALSCVFVATGFASTLAPFLSRDEQPVAEFTVTALGANAANPRVADARPTSIGVVYVDGRRVPLDSIQRDPTWQLLRSGPTVEGDRSVLFHDGRGPPATLRLRGRHILIGLGHSGVSGKVRISRDDGLEHIVDGFDAEDPSLHYVWHEWPGTASPWWSFALCLGALLGLAALLRPWRSEGRADVWVALHATLAHLWVWLGQPVVVSADSTAYEETYRLFFAAGQSAYFPPGYPLFIELARWLPLGDATAAKVTALQALLLVGCAIALRRALRSVGPTAAFGAALWISSSATTLMMGRAVMSEGVAMFSVVAALHFTLQARRTGRARHAVLAGLLGAISVVSRVTPAVVVGTFFLAHILPWSQRRPRLLLLSLAALVSVSALPLVWFAAHGGRAEFANSSGPHVYNRVVFGGQLLDRDAPASRQFLGWLGADVDPFERDHTLTRMLLRGKGHNPPEIRELLGKVAIESIRAFPFRYLIGSLGQAAYQCARAPSMDAASWFQQASPKLEDPPLLGVSEAAFAWMYVLVEWEALVWPGIVGLALIGGAWIALRHRHTGALLVLSIIPTIAIPEAFVEASYPRRSAMMAPPMLALAAVGIAALGSRLSRRRQT